LCALRGERPDRVPYALGFFPQGLFEAADADELFGSDVRFVEAEAPPAQDAFLAYLEGLPPDLHIGSTAQLRTYWEWGYEPRRPGDPPLGTLESAGRFVTELADRFSGRGGRASVAERVARLHDRGLAVAAAPPHLGGELFETAYRLRGFARFMADLLENEKLVDYLLDQLLAMLLEDVVALAEAGVDVLLLDDDVAACKGLLISPVTWRRFFRPRMARLIEGAREAAPGLLVFYHSDGDFSRLVPDLVEIGVDVVNPLQPDCMDARAIRAGLGPRPAFWGAVGTARLWAEATPTEVQAEVRLRLAELGPAGLLLAPAYDIDFAPRENVEAFVQAVRQFG